MSAENLAAEVISATGPGPFSDAAPPHDAVIFCAAVNASYARFLSECAIIDNETLYRADDAIDYPHDGFVKKTSSAPVLFVEIEKDLVAHEEIFGADGSMAEKN